MNYDDLKSAVEAKGSDPIWSGRAVALLDALQGTGIDLASDNAALLSHMDAVKEQHPRVNSFLRALPGYPDDQKRAEDQIGYLTIQFRGHLEGANNPI